MQALRLPGPVTGSSALWPWPNGQVKGMAKRANAEVGHLAVLAIWPSQEDFLLVDDLP